MVSASFGSSNWRHVGDGVVTGEAVTTRVSPVAAPSMRRLGRDAGTSAFA